MTSLQAHAWFYPLLGWLVGGLGISLFWLTKWLFPPELAVLTSMMVTIWLTSAYHEAGFAQVCDGQGNSWSATPARTGQFIRPVGLYGFLGLGLLLVVRYLALKNLLTLEAFGWPMVLKYVAAHSLSYFMALTAVDVLPPVHPDQPATARVPKRSFVLAALSGLLPLLALVAWTGLWIYLTFLIPLALVSWGLMRGFNPQPGDDRSAGPGATQQLAEVIIYLSFVSLLWISI